jgi:hypothetical protein
MAAVAPVTLVGLRSDWKAGEKDVTVLLEMTDCDELVGLGTCCRDGGLETEMTVAVAVRPGVPPAGNNPTMTGFPPPLLTTTPPG